MNKEQIKQFWDDHKDAIIGGALVLGSLVLIGVSVGSAVNASKRSTEAYNKDTTRYHAFCNEAVEIGAEMKKGCPFPVATKEVAERFLQEKGEVYLLGYGVGEGINIVYAFDKKAAKDVECLLS